MTRLSEVERDALNDLFIVFSSDSIFRRVVLSIKRLFST